MSRVICVREGHHLLTVGQEYTLVASVNTDKGIFYALEIDGAWISEWYLQPVREPASPPDIKEAVNHPAHYGGADNPYEAIKVIEAWQLNFNLGTVVKYISRAGKKDPAKHLEDLKKSRWYLDREIQNIEKGEG